MGSLSAYENQIQTLCSGLYDIVLGNETWTQALAPLLPLFHARAFHLFTLNANYDAVRNIALGGYTPDDLVASYVNYYVKIDPRGQSAARLPVGSVLPCHLIHNEAFIRGNETYQDFVIPSGFHNTLIAAPARLGAEKVVFGLMRPDRPGFYTKEEVTVLSQVMSHVGRALLLQQKFHTLEMASIAQQKALDTLSFGILIVDHEGYIHHANAGAEKLLTDIPELIVRAGKISLQSISANAKLAKLIDVASNRGIGGGMPVTLNSHAESLMIWAAPVRQGLALLQRPLVVLALIDPREGVPANTILKQAFGLTPAESSLAQALGKGTSINAFAELHQVSVTTVRTQVRSIYEKTGVSRQTDLARLLSQAGILKTAK